ncbi:hypothetical protein [Mesoplasma corruscae]|uniref:hypothetical protein n=1 Tax=Mesoplasma corruscae TaxID=216874 RepID=UPI001CA49F52|nr:hypothetical protein [Mesoplasma corruscae]
MPGQDLLKFYLDDNSWFAVCPSGTEPKLKIYFVGADSNEKLAQTKVERIYQELKILLKI